MATDECKTLDSIYQSLNLYHDGPCCEWHGVKCSRDDLVVHLELFTLFQSPVRMPVGVGNLTNLAVLKLSPGRFSGPIPTELGRLSNLEYLDMSNNQLSGSIPSELGQLSKLEYLYLDGNKLSGSIPIDLGKLSKIRELFLQDNQLSGSIPAELANIPNLGTLILNKNNLSGPIPRLPKVSLICEIASSSNADKHCLAPTFQKTGQCWEDMELLSIPDCSANGSIPTTSPSPTKPFVASSPFPFGTLLSVLASVCFFGLSCLITFRKFHHQISSTQKRNDPEAQTSRSTLWSICRRPSRPC
ncbi:hypothetical protein BCR44DRAFT_1190415 [Catenaria anguillulae PL171]|uniref:non-specific serine/threonine protein kinase n=1 Tax=Catenaria anguillulae PL171 TaxID=765915 RepID=A0A1Y2HJ81_9FUNG|nr:hypothetical protein BCR44DRAFT_1190415 [Catenaria anguillulae PL171]